MCDVVFHLLITACTIILHVAHHYVLQVLIVKYTCSYKVYRGLVFNDQRLYYYMCNFLHIAVRMKTEKRRDDGMCELQSVLLTVEYYVPKLKFCFFYIYTEKWKFQGGTAIHDGDSSLGFCNFTFNIKIIRDLMGTYSL